MDQFDQPIDLVLKNGKEALFKWCFNRCYQAFNFIYEYEQTKTGSLWRFDDRYYEHGIQILYERFCFAMAIIVDEFHMECTARYDAKDTRFESLSDVQRRVLTFNVFISGGVDEVFKRGTRDMGWSDGTVEYGDIDYTDDEYERFWEQHKLFQHEINLLRASFSPHERDYLHGFANSDYTEADDDPTWNLDCVHVMRVSKISGDVDVSKFLGNTKRYYLPTIIKTFMTNPSKDIFAPIAPASKWWQFWKS